MLFARMIDHESNPLVFYWRLIIAIYQCGEGLYSNYGIKFVITDFWRVVVIAKIRTQMQCWLWSLEDSEADIASHFCKYYMFYLYENVMSLKKNADYDPPKVEPTAA